MKALLPVLLSLTALGNAARILAIVPINVKSHYVIVEPLLQELAARGHQLTVYSSFPKKSPFPNFTDVDLTKGRQIHVNNFDFKSIQLLLENGIKDMHHVMRLVGNDCEELFNDSELKYFDHKREKYDLVITEMFAGDCFVHFAHKLDAPLVSIVTSIPLPWIPDHFGLPDNPSYIPNCMMRLTPDMTFLERLKNTMFIAYAKVMYNFISNSRVQKLAEDHFKEPLPWVGSVARNSSLLLVNTHPSISHSRPLPPNVVDIGGIHIKEPQPLPTDLQEILDNSPQGAVLFSFGSMVRIASMPKEKLNLILRVFSKISQTVIMKYEENLPNLPKNVITRSWFPQRDMLDHKNVVTFISHGGLASVMEAVYCATPMVGVPLFADQFVNINNLVWKGAAVTVDVNTMDEHDFEHAINEVINNPKYRENMKAMSEQFRDRPLTALQSAVYWTEYVLRHRGAPHLRPASTGLPFYQVWLLDVIALLLSALTVIIYSVYYSTKSMISALKRKSNVVGNSNKKKK